MAQAAISSGRHLICRSHTSPSKLSSVCLGPPCLASGMLIMLAGKGVGYFSYSPNYRHSLNLSRMCNILTLDTRGRPTLHGRSGRLRQPGVRTPRSGTQILTSCSARARPDLSPWGATTSSVDYSSFNVRDTNHRFLQFAINSRRRLTGTATMTRRSKLYTCLLRKCEIK